MGKKARVIEEKRDSLKEKLKLLQNSWKTSDGFLLMDI